MKLLTKKIIGISMCGFLLLSTKSVSASSNVTIDLGKNVLTNLDLTADKAITNENVSEARVPDSEVEQLVKDVSNSNEVQSRKLPSEYPYYEPNNSIETAFPYSQTEKIKCRGKDDIYGHYNCFHTWTSLDSEDDLDFFKVNVQPGFRYVAILKNVYIDRIMDIRLYYQKADGSWWYKYPTKKDGGQSIFHFTPEYSTYYIRISGSAAPGYTFTPDITASWFAVERDGTIDERAGFNDPKPSCSLK